MSALLETDDVVAGYLPDVPILNGVSIHAEAGEIVTIVGPNGAGKSTLVKTIFGLLTPRRGSIRLEGKELGGRRSSAIARMGLGYVPQRDNVFASLTVHENLELGSFDRRTTAARIDQMYELFPRLGERVRQRAGTMSGGERQMVAMARALMPDPRILLVDEPSAGLSPAFVDVIFDKLREVNERGVTIVMVEQNARRALAMSDRGYVLDLGVNRFEGRGQELLDDPKVAQLYLGGTARVDAPAAVPEP
jgi:ABC-type branched-subunit amino acid transport system ATPase component